MKTWADINKREIRWSDHVVGGGAVAILPPLLLWMEYFQCSLMRCVHNRSAGAARISTRNRLALDKSAPASRSDDSIRRRSNRISFGHYRRLEYSAERVCYHGNSSCLFTALSFLFQEPERERKRLKSMDCNRITPFSSFPNHLRRVKE